MIEKTITSGTAEYIRLAEKNLNKMEFLIMILLIIFLYLSLLYLEI